MPTNCVPQCQYLLIYLWEAARFPSGRGWRGAGASAIVFTVLFCASSKVALQRSSGLDETGNIVWYLALCLLLSWMIVGAALFKGIKSSGKVSEEKQTADSGLILPSSTPVSAGLEGGQHKAGCGANPPPSAGPLARLCCCSLASEPLHKIWVRCWLHSIYLRHCSAGSTRAALCL